MRKLIRIVIVAVSVIALVLLVSGCNIQEPANTRIIKDCSGAEVEIKNNIERVIAPNLQFCSFMIAMGQGDKLIGTHGAITNQLWATYFKDDIRNIEQYPYKPEAESLYAAEADLVVVKNAAYAETLRKAGIPAIYFAYNNLDELYYAVDLMGEIFGTDAKNYGDRWKTYLKETVANINQDLSSLSDSDKRNVYYINAAVNPGNLYTTYGGESFTEYWINTIGCNLVTSSFPNIEEIDQEVAISLNPDTIIISGYAQYTRYDELTADPLWTDIDAVNNREIYCMPTAFVSFDRFAMELPLLLDYSANLLYPDLHMFSGIDSFRKFFDEFYGIVFSDEDLNNMMLGLNPDGSRIDQ